MSLLITVLGCVIIAGFTFLPFVWVQAKGYALIDRFN